MFKAKYSDSPPLGLRFDHIKLYMCTKGSKRKTMELVWIFCSVQKKDLGALGKKNECFNSLPMPNRNDHKELCTLPVISSFFTYFQKKTQK